MLSVPKTRSGFQKFLPIPGDTVNSWLDTLIVTLEHFRQQRIAFDLFIDSHNPELYSLLPHVEKKRGDKEVFGEKPRDRRTHSSKKILLLAIMGRDIPFSRQPTLEESQIFLLEFERMNVEGYREEKRL